MMKLVVGLLGAASLDSEAIVDALAEMDFDNVELGELRVFAGKSHTGKRIYCGTSKLAVEEVNLKRLCECDVLFVSSEVGLDLEKLEKLHASGTVVIHHASQFDFECGAPRMIPGLLSQKLSNSGWLNSPSIVLPQPCMALVALALAPLMQKLRVGRVAVTALVSASDFGGAGLDVLQEETQAFFQAQDLSSRASGLVPRSLAFNVMPFEESDGASVRMGSELVELLGDPCLKVDVSPVRVPVFVGDSASVVLELEHSVNLDDARKILSAVTALDVCDADTNSDSISACSPRELQGSPVVRVSHLRHTSVFEHGLALWITGDNLKRGFAMCAVGFLSDLVETGVIQALRKKKM